MLQSIIKATGYLNDFSELIIQKMKQTQYVVCYISVGL